MKDELYYKYDYTEILDYRQFFWLIEYLYDDCLAPCCLDFLVKIGGDVG